MFRQYTKVVWSLAIAMLGTPRFAAGQTQQGLVDAIAAAIAKATDVRPRMVHVATPVMTVDTAKRTVVVVLRNIGPDTLTADLSLTLRPPVLGQKPVAHTASGLLADDSSASASGDSVTVRSLIPWIKDLPKQIRLAPQQTDTLLLRIDVPKGAEAGEYTAWIVATTSITFKSQTYSGDQGAGAKGSVHVDMARGSGGRAPSAGKLILHYK